MTYILFGLGILFILIGFVDVFPKVKESYLDAEELYKWQKQKSEVNQAKDDLMELMDELRKVSDQVVENIEYKVKEAQTLKLASEEQHLPSKDNNVDKAINQQAKKLKQNLEKSTENTARTNLITAKNNNENTPDGTKGNRRIENKPKNDTKFKEILTSNLNDVNPTLDKHTYIYQLAKEGLSVEEIAQKVQVGKGEVELIIGIKRRGEQA